MNFTYFIINCIINIQNNSELDSQFHPKILCKLSCKFYTIIQIFHIFYHWISLNGESCIETLVIIYLWPSGFQYPLNFRVKARPMLVQRGKPVHDWAWSRHMLANRSSYVPRVLLTIIPDCVAMPGWKHRASPLWSRPAHAWTPGHGRSYAVWRFTELRWRFIPREDFYSGRNSGFSSRHGRRLRRPTAVDSCAIL